MESIPKSVSSDQVLSTYNHLRVSRDREQLGWLSSLHEKHAEDQISQTILDVSVRIYGSTPQNPNKVAFLNGAQ